VECTYSKRAEFLARYYRGRALGRDASARGSRPPGMSIRAGIECVTARWSGQRPEFAPMVTIFADSFPGMFGVRECFVVRCVIMSEIDAAGKVGAWLVG
jgi:hypothetical protein